MNDDQEARMSGEEILQLIEDTIDAYINLCKGVNNGLSALKEIPLSSRELIKINCAQRMIPGAVDRLRILKSELHGADATSVFDDVFQERLTKEKQIIRKAYDLSNEIMSKRPESKVGIILFLLIPYTIISHHIKMFLYNMKIRKLK